jgi:predicted TIM-barrel fold metal-dependent hydrolase
METQEFRGNLVRDSAAQQRWLAQRAPEAALEPELPIVDAHHHLMHMPAHGLHYLLDRFAADLASGHHIVATVCVEGSGLARAHGPEALRPLGEIESLRGMAAMAESGQFGPTRVAQAIVGHVDLRLGDAAGAVLDAAIEAGGGRLRGIRHATAWDAGTVGRHMLRPCPPHLLGDAPFRQGVRALQARGLALDVWVFHHQLDDVWALAQAFPDLDIVLDHAGTLLGVAEHAATPEARQQAQALWREGLARLAPLPNVSVKVGGLGMPLVGLPFHHDETPPHSVVLAEAWAPWLHACLEHFGPQRCMFESNFPIDRQSCGYGELWNAFKRMSARLSPGERSALFSGTASRVYRLAPIPPQEETSP